MPRGPGTHRVPRRGRADRRPRRRRLLRPTPRTAPRRATTSSAGSCRWPRSGSPPPSTRACAPAGAPRSRSSSACSAIVAGLEGWHYTREVGASGDDYTGLLALPAGVVLLVLAAVTLWRSRRRDGSRARRYLRRAPDRRGGSGRGDRGGGAVHGRLRLHPPGPGGRAGPEARRRRLRGREVRDERRPRARGLVHPLEERGGGDRLPRAQRPAQARALPRPPRLRRAAVRPARRGRERGRPELARLGRDEGRGRGDRVPAHAARRGPRAHRRHRALGRRRDAARVGRRHGRAQGRGLRGRGHPLRQGGPGAERDGEVGPAPDVGGHDARAPWSSRAGARPRT